MKKNLLQLFFLVLITNQTYATHNRSGYITCKHISGYTYQITVVTLTKESSFGADRCELTVFFGDGDSANFQRNNGSTINIDGDPYCSYYGQPLGGDTKINVYTGTHTFSGIGRYTVSMFDQERTTGICNIPNSENSAFYIYTDLYVYDPEKNCISSSVDFAAFPLFAADAGISFQTDIPIAFSDNDSISYELANCKIGDTTDAPGYSIPDGLSINATTGRVSWLNPPAGCIYNIAIKIKKWRKSILAGETFVDFQIETDSIGLLNPGRLPMSSSSCVTNADSTFVCAIAPNTLLDIDLLSGNCIVRECYSEINYLSNVGKFDSTAFLWTPNTGNVRKNPYKITFRTAQAFSVSADSNYRDYTCLIYVTGNSTIDTCTPPFSIPVITPPKYKYSPHAYPNPSKGVFIITSKVDSATIRVTDMIGNIVLETPLTKGYALVDLSTQNDGLYFYNIYISNSYYERGKLFLTK